MHKHHIVFKSQGGLDFNLNYHYFNGPEDHEGSGGPHLNRKVDIILKKDLQNKLKEEFKDKPYYDIKEIARIINVTEKYLSPHFKSVPSAAGQFHRDDIIRKLMGGKLY